MPRGQIEYAAGKAFTFAETKCAACGQACLIATGKLKGASKLYDRIIVTAGRVDNLQHSCTSRAKPTGNGAYSAR